MPWVKLDDSFDEHPKIDALSDAAFRLHVAGLCYSARNLSDGHIPSVRAPRLTVTAKARHIAELVTAGVWDAVDDGYMIHDFLEYQRARTDVLSEREAARVRMENVRANKKRTPPERSPEVRLPRPDPTPTKEVTSSHNSTEAVDKSAEEQRIEVVLGMVAKQRMAAVGNVRQPQAWMAKTVEKMRLEELLDVEALKRIREYPDLTDPQLRDVLMGNTTILRHMKRATA